MQRSSATPPPDEPAYDAFISYSHANQHLAERISRRLRSYRPPRVLALPKRRLRIFRDTETLTASVDLTDELVRRLHASKHLVVLCSPSAAASQYVNAEIEVFLEAGRREALFVVLLDGTPETSFPPALQAAADEPLFIDLREAGRGLRGYRQFREATLRLAAALFGVDFSALRREDEKRRRQRRTVGVLSSLLLTLLVGSTWLAGSVPADAWTPVPLPDSHRDSPVMPVQQVAVNSADPSLLLYQVRDANFESQQPDLPLSIVPGEGLPDAQTFSEQTRAYFAEATSSLPLTEPLAVLRIGFPETYDRPPGNGELQVFGVMDSETGHLRFYRTFSLGYPSAEAPPPAISLPPTLSPTGPFDLEPWPLVPLLDSMVFPVGGALHGTLENRLTGTTNPIAYQVFDLDESFWEANDGMWFDTDVIANRSDETILLEGETVPLDEIDEFYETWEEILNLPAWEGYQPPATLQISDLLPYRRDNADEHFARLAAQVRDAALARALIDSLVWEYELHHTMRIVGRIGRRDSLKVATVITRAFDEIAYRREDIVQALYLLQPEADSTWHPIRFNPQNPRTEIIDVLALDTTGQALVLLTDREGFYRSTDRGRTWQDFNGGETQLLNGRKVRPIITVQPFALYALVDHYGIDGQGTNALFRQQRRGWLHRLRLGLIALLNGSA